MCGVWGTEQSLLRPQDIPELDVKRLGRGDLSGEKRHTPSFGLSPPVWGMGNFQTDVSTWNSKVTEVAALVAEVVALVHSESGQQLFHNPPPPWRWTELKTRRGCQA